MFFLQMIALTAVGFLVAKWALKGAYELGHNDFAYGKGDLLTWIMCTFYESLVYCGIFCFIFTINSLVDRFNGNQIVMTMSNNHIVNDMLFAGISAKILMAAWIIEGIRIRKNYYELIAPLRKMYLSFPADRLVRPSFSQLYRLW